MHAEAMQWVRKWETHDPEKVVIELGSRNTSGAGIRQFGLLRRVFDFGFVEHAICVGVGLFEPLRPHFGESGSEFRLVDTGGLYGASEDPLHALVIEQGYEMGRPSDLSLEADVVAGRLASVRVAGQAVQIMEGVLDL